MSFIKELIEAIDVDNVLDDSKKTELSEAFETKLSERISKAKQEGVEEGKANMVQERDELIKEAEKNGYEKGVNAALEEVEEATKEAEELGYNAGARSALDEAEKVANEYDDEVKTALSKLADVIDQFIEVMTKKTQIDTQDAVVDDITETLSNFLDEKASELIPESVIIDYDRIQTLERTMSLIKESVMLSQPEIQSKMKQIEESAIAAKKRAEQALITESERRVIAEQKLAKKEAKLLLTEKLEDIPAYERNILKNRFATASVQEINESFDQVYESIQNNMGRDTENKQISSELVTEEVIDNDDNKVPETNNKKIVTESTEKPKNAMQAYAELIKRSSANHKSHQK